MASNSQFQDTSFLYGGNAAFIEGLYDRYVADPNSVDESWRELFGTVAKAANGSGGGAVQPAWARANGNGMTGVLAEDYMLPAVKAKRANGAALKAEATRENAAATPADAKAGKALTPEAMKAATLDSVRASQMIRAYRARGHLAAKLDPLNIAVKPPMPELDPANYGFTAADMDRSIFIDNVLGLQYATMREIVEICRDTYCGSIGYEFVHVTDPEQKRWIQERVEGREKGASFTLEGKKAILNKLIEAEGFEQYCTRKFTGTKRFGLDGGESLIPALEQIIKRGGALGAKELVFGMPHRGRLNVLANVLSKPYLQIFTEFQGGSSSPKDVGGSGDVKYHLGASSNREFDGNKVHLSLAPNPSHLEAVNPVVLGKSRAKQMQHADGGDINIGRNAVIPVLMHGDAAFAGQGVVAECFAMSGTRGYRTGGTIHIVVNNQIGFTTSPHHGRSSPYPSDIAKMVEAPILHVNGDDPEAVVHCARIATEFRQRFQHDVVLDMFCYRRFGHNETLEPTFTQPLMYQAIKGQPTTLNIYAKRLVDEGTMARDEVDAMKAEFTKRLDDDLEASKTFKANKADWLDGLWSGMEAGNGVYKRGDTAVSVEVLKEVGNALSHVPDSFNAHRTVSRQLAAKAAMFETGQGLDWATAEALAFGTLALEGVPVRLSGQDSREGTFSQRHAALVDQADEHRYVLLNHVRESQAQVEVIDSLLSEFAVLGFEYGYSTAAPNTLVLWEAQFGDFSNGAQVIIDQFIASGESKWLRLSGLVLLLPHGYEGQGPEHSSARPERFLQLCAQKNMQVANLTTPANYYHALRRQIRRSHRKPLVLMTPKSLLRHKRAVSQLVEMGPGTSFHRLLWDDAEVRPGYSVKLKADKDIRRVLLCSGKVYYDLFEDREKRGLEDVQIIRVEQLYPYPEDAVEREMLRFKGAEIVWVQEEPKNQGYWSYVAPLLDETLVKVGNTKGRVRYIGRAASASPATGLSSTHAAELKAFLDDSFAA